MGNEERHQRVTFDLQDCPNCSFLNPLTDVKFSFQEIGEPDLFQPTHKSVKTAASRSPLYSLPVIPQVNTLAVTDVPRVTTQQPALLASMTQKQFNNVMSSYQTTHQQKKRLLQTDRHCVRTQEIRLEHPVRPVRPQMAPAQWLHPSPLGAIQPASCPPCAPGWSISHPNLPKKPKESDP